MPDAKGVDLLEFWRSSCDADLVACLTRDRDAVRTCSTLRIACTSEGVCDRSAADFRAASWLRQLGSGHRIGWARAGALRVCHLSCIAAGHAMAEGAGRRRMNEPEEVEASALGS